MAVGYSVQLLRLLEWADSEFNCNSNGACHDAVHRLYQSVLYFQNITPFHGTCVTVNSSPPITAVWISLHPFSQTPHINTAALCADVYTKIHPYRTINSDVMDRHSHRSWIKVWQAVNQFTRHSFQSTILCGCLLCQTLSKSEENARNAGTYAFRCLSKICFRLTGSQDTHKCPSELSGDLLHWI